VKHPTFNHQRRIMTTYRSSYPAPPPDTEGLDHVKMRNASSALNYDEINGRMDAAKPLIVSRTRKMLERIRETGQR
jgi:hypothetical protein